jgi:hypothetical protein
LARTNLSATSVLRGVYRTSPTPPCSRVTENRETKVEHTLTHRFMYQMCNSGNYGIGADVCVTSGFPFPQQVKPLREMNCLAVNAPKSREISGGMGGASPQA